MDRKQLLNPDAVKILTTEEFLAFEKQERIKSYVHKRMDKGKKGKAKKKCSFQIFGKTSYKLHLYILVMTNRQTPTFII